MVWVLVWWVSRVGRLVSCCCFGLVRVWLKMVLSVVSWFSLGFRLVSWLCSCLCMFVMCVVMVCCCWVWCRWYGVSRLVSGGVCLGSGVVDFWVSLVFLKLVCSLDCRWFSVVLV